MKQCGKMETNCDRKKCRIKKWWLKLLKTMLDANLKVEAGPLLLSKSQGT
jgi:hypothetical protein